MDHFPYLFAGFSVVWVVIFAYLLGIDRRSRRAEQELEELKRRLGR